MEKIIALFSSLSNLLESDEVYSVRHAIILMDYGEKFQEFVGDGVAYDGESGENFISPWEASYEEYFQLIVSELFLKVMTELNSLALTKSKKENTEIVQRLISYVSLLKAKYAQKDRKQIDVTPGLGHQLENFQKKLELQLSYLENESKPNSKKVLVGNSSVFKIKWNHGVASLCTMFYELANNSALGNGTTFISATNPELIDFISDNFIDENGEPFARSSLKTYVSNRSDKKSKGNKRVNLENLTKKMQGKSEIE